MVLSSRQKSCSTASAEFSQPARFHHGVRGDMLYIRPASIRLLAVSAAIALLTACPKRTAVWVVEGSTPSKLQFGLGERLGHEKNGHVSFLVVQRCGNVGDSQLRIWALLPEQGGSGPGLPGRVYLGIAPPGFLQEGQGGTLGPGSYLALTDGSGRVGFTIDSSGAIQSPSSCV